MQYPSPFVRRDGELIPKLRLKTTCQFQEMQVSRFDLPDILHVEAIVGGIYAISP